MISQRANSIKPSLTLGVTATAKKMRQEGKDVVSFGAGEPDFPTPPNIKDAAIRAINEDFTYYTPTAGIEPLRKAIADKLQNFNHISYEPEQVIVSCGGKHSLYNIMQVLLDPKDEVLLNTPYWVSYLEQIRLTGAIPKLISKVNEKIDFDNMRKQVTNKTKFLILNSPANPDGTVSDESELKYLADFALEHDLWIVSDEVYECFVYNGIKQMSIASLNDEIMKKTIISNSFSKTYSMTGWRIGYTAGPKDVITSIKRLQDHMTSNPTSIAQMAALEALKGPQDSIKKMIEAFDKRRMVMVTRLNEMKGIDCKIPKGAFYAFPEIKNTGLTSIKFAERLLNEENIAVIPGVAFGKDDNIRLSYATSMPEIEKGMNRIEQFCNKL
ncbi:pyridoxal phosphate-dependent aminotransferase [Candidatus Bathyarchaeota archaeon]|nr:pyridoxal phosphate-dependent aminotransferase [Candidatus Bathyarchaeota archaeon]